MDNDSRCSLPSASGIARIFACRGSWLAEKDLPEISSEDAQAGTEQHKAFETGDDSGLSEEAGEIQAKARETEQQMVADWLISIGRVDYTENREERLWIYEKDDRRCSAKLDYFAISGPFALVLDLKTGRNEVTPAPDNWQLRTQAIAVVQNFSVGTVAVGIVQPGQRHETFEYTFKPLILHVNELFEVLADARNPKAIRTPGEAQCKYCRARATCPEARATIERTTFIKPLAPSTMRWEMTPPDVKRKWFEQIKVAKIVIKEIEKRIKADLEADPQSIPGLVLEESQGDRKVIDVNEIYNEIEYLRSTGGFGIAPEILREWFQTSCSLPVGKLSELVKKLTGWKTKDVDSWLSEHCSDWVKRGQPSKSIESRRRVEHANCTGNEEGDHP